MTVVEWTTDNAAHLAAALAYYTIFSIVPLMVIALSLAGLVLGRDAARGELTAQVRVFTNSPGLAELIETLAQNLPTTEATIIGLIVLLYGATGVFAELKNALNHIWDVPTKDNQGIWSLVLGRLIALAMVIISGLVMLLSLFVTTVLTAATDWVNHHWPGMAFTSQAVNFIFFFVVTGIVFALTYKYVPDIRIAWRDVIIGATATSLLFSLGRWLLSLYLARTPVAPLFGAASSLIVFLLWTYYSAQIFFLGAEFTQVYARTYGTRQSERPIVADELLKQEEAAGELAGLAGQPASPEQPPGSLARPASGWRRWGRTVRPARDIGLALGIIALVSVYNLVREPFRK